MILTMPQAAQYFYDAGFRGNSVAYITAIAQAESSLDTTIVSGVVSDGTRGYGLVQIETENLDGGDWQSPAWQASKALVMSGGGTDFRAWCSACLPIPCGGYTKGCGGYGSGAAGQYLAEAFAAVNEVRVPTPPPTPAVPHPPMSPWPGIILQVQTPPIQWHGTQRWQEQLNIVIKPWLPKPLVTDGSFGLLTEEATKIFQPRSGLPATGKVDKLTWDHAWSYSGPNG